jgi:hypothetical protein
MGVTAIDPRAPVVAALHAQLSAPARRLRARVPVAPQSPGAAQTPTMVVVQRLAAIDRADPDRRRKAVRLVLEAQLAREFGPDLLNDPGFPVMLDAVQQDMEADVQAAAAARALGDLLLTRP